jgi:tetratricopeptide (TPR) repeat protein
MTNVPTPPASAHDPPSDRLDSWKEIASYLNRDVSTVQRWEKRERMPVHRHQHDKLGSVYAFRAELDAWWLGRGAQLAGQDPGGPVQESAPGSDGEPQSAQVAVQRRPPLWFWLGLTAAAVLAAAASVGVLRGVAWPGNRTRADVMSTVSDSATTKQRVNPQANDLLWQARYLSVRTTNEDNKRVIELLEQAIALDPDFAAAYGELASAYVTRLAYVTPDESRELEQKAFSMAHKALAIDPNAPEGYIGRGDLLWTRSHRFAHESAVQQFRHALALNPNSDETHRRLARVFVHIGFFEEAIQHADIALSMNPSNAQALNSRAQALLWMGKDEEAVAILSSVPGPVLPELVDANLVFAMLRLNRRNDASDYLKKAKDKYSTDLGGTLTGMEAVLLADSDPVAAQKLIDGLSKRKATNTSHHSAYFAAIASARMRRVDEAVQWLREASETGFPCYSLFARDPNLDPIRQEPEFQRFTTEMEKRSNALRKILFP